MNLITTYYNSPGHLDLFLDSNYHSEVIDKIIVVDDGSILYPAYPILKDHRLRNVIELYVVDEDLGFNSHGCRNLAMKVTDQQWNFLVDIDRTFDLPFLVQASKHTTDTRNTIHCRFTNYQNQLSINDYIISKSFFWQCGGYDEEFRNMHTGDRRFVQMFQVCGGNSIVIEDVGIIATRGARDKILFDQNISLIQYPNDYTVVYPPTPQTTFPVDQMYGIERTDHCGIEQMIDRRNKQRPIIKPTVQFKYKRML